MNRITFLICLLLPLMTTAQEMTVPLSHFVSFKSNLNRGFAAEAESGMFSLEAGRQNQFSLHKYALSGVIPVGDRLALFGSLSTLINDYRVEDKLRAGLSSSFQWGKFNVNPSVEGSVGINKYDIDWQIPFHTGPWWGYHIAPAILLQYGSFFLGSTYHTWATDDFKPIHAFEIHFGADVQVNENFSLNPVFVYLNHNWNEGGRLFVTSKLWNRLTLGVGHSTEEGLEPVVGVRLGSVQVSYSSMIEEQYSYPGPQQQLETVRHGLSLVWEMD